MKPTFDEIIDSLDVAAKNYPIKALAAEMEDKAESTLRNELTQQRDYKLGLRTAIFILKKTKDLRALDQIESLFNRVAFNLPRPEPGKVEPVLKIVGDLTMEFGGLTRQMASALTEGRITKKEAIKCLKELRDVIEACTKLQAYLELID